LNKRIGLTIAGVAALIAAAIPVARAHEGGGEGHGSRHAKRTLLISIDGFHELDFQNCANGISTINGGAQYCPTLAALAKTGVNYVNGSTSKPSDSFPGLMTMVSGASPGLLGVYYDVAYDRVLAPPQNTTGNGVNGGTCTPNVNNGTRTEYEEGIDLDQNKLNGGEAVGDGDVNSIDPTKLERDPFNSCKPVYPNNFVRANTIFGVIHKAGGYAAWADKHAAYMSVAGPGDGSNLDDFYGPEINSLSSNYISLPHMTVMDCSTLPDQASVAAGDDYTTSFQNIQCYDSLKVQSIINQIDGKNHNGSKAAPVPNIFGMNFQAVSIGQKLIYQDGTVATGYSVHGGYLDALGTPSPSLYQEIIYVDHSIGLMVAELKQQHLLDSTLIVISAKHGQSPIDPNRFFPIPGHSGTNGTPPSAILGPAFLPDSEINQIGPTEDDVSLLWLSPGASVSDAVAMLAMPANETLAGIGEIFSGNSLAPIYNTPGVPPNGDPRTPDIIVAPNVGVVYTGSKKKDAEHGGFAHDDTNVIMLLSRPCMASRTSVETVSTAQIAPTILKAMDLDPGKLDGVKKEHTQVLPGVPSCSDDD
jgi:hypothetical protein